ncbi:MAG: TIM barrel protein [Candidatus Lokiarchaeota archaeon]|nr:TIM barrel protein [Candidatus Lokiarchaeota archaeon]MBD3341405.1 TIM barrel protein [Candidatus Lokiarchaeota archaeon]
MAFEKNIKSLVHFMAFPGPRLGHTTMLGEAPEKYLLDSLKFLKNLKYFDGLEVTHVKDPEVKAKFIKALKSFKHITFAAQPIQLINEDELIASTGISSIDELERINAVNRLKWCIKEAYEYGASQFTFLSGEDPGTEQGLRTRRLATGSLIKSIDQICQFNKQVAKKLNKKPLKITLETFDRLSDEGCKNQLIGPSDEARSLAVEIRNVYDHQEFGLLFDLSHMYLLKNGYDHETVNIIRTIAPFLNWVHIANSVSDKDDPNYGDTHVSMDYPNGTVTPDDLKNFLKELKDVEFEQGIGFEYTPRGRQLSESVVKIAIAGFEEARQQIDVNYALGSYRFKTRRFLPEKIFYMITEAKRSGIGEILEQEYKNRIKRPMPWDSNIVIIAADHPARRVTKVGTNEIAMGDRQQYLGRIVRTLMLDEIDGVMTTPDIMDDLFILNNLIKQYGGKSFLDNKILIGCTNRGGLSGSTFEMDDHITAYTIQDIKRLGLDGAKMMFRLDLDTNMARYSQRTMQRCAKMVRECNLHNIPAFIEPLPVEQQSDGSYGVKMNSDDLIKTVGIATALGGRSANIWLKIPYVENYEYVVRSTSNPILMLGGKSTGNPTDILENFEKGLGAGKNVKGCLVGRNLLYPGYDDPQAVGLAVSKIIHENMNTEEAVKILANSRGEDMDFLTSKIMGISLTSAEIGYL